MFRHRCVARAVFVATAALVLTEASVQLPALMASWHPSRLVTTAGGESIEFADPISNVTETVEPAPPGGAAGSSPVRRWAAETGWPWRCSAFTIELGTEGGVRTNGILPLAKHSSPAGASVFETRCDLPLVGVVFKHAIARFMADWLAIGVVLAALGWLCGAIVKRLRRSSKLAWPARAATLLAVGALLTFAVANGPALWGTEWQTRTETFHSPDETVGRRALDETDPKLVAVREAQAAWFAERTTWTLLSDMRSYPTEHVSIEPIPPSEAEAISLLRDPRREIVRTSRWARGWPLRAFGAEFDEPRHLLERETPAQPRGGRVVGGIRSGSSAEVVAFSPLWLGFVVDSALYGAAVGCALLLVVTMPGRRAASRLLAGRCPTCGYPLLADRCAECGSSWPRLRGGTARTSPAPDGARGPDSMGVQRHSGAGQRGLSTS